MDHEKRQMRAHGKDPEEGYQSHGYTDMHARHSYITTHMFYEDLRDVQDSLPPQDIYEQLSTKDDVADIAEAAFVDEEERKSSKQ